MPREFIHNPTAAVQAGGMRVETVGMTLEQRHAKPPPGCSAVLGYCWLTLADGLGNRFAVSNCRLIEWGSGDRDVNYPKEQRPERCPSCSGTNKPAAKFCNDCGGRLTPPVNVKPRYHQHANPACDKTAGMILRAVEEAYAAARAAERPAGVAPAFAQPPSAPAESVVV